MKKSVGIISGLAILVLCAGCNSPSGDQTGGHNTPVLNNLQEVSLSGLCSPGTVAVGALSGSQVTVSGNADIEGELLLSENGSLEASGNSRISAAIADPSSSVREDGHDAISSLTVSDVTAQEQAVDDIATTAGQLRPTQTLDGLTGTVTLKGNGGLNVIAINGDLSFAGQDALTLEGSESDHFIFNVTGEVNFSGQSKINLVGVASNQVLFNVIGTGGGVTISGQASVAGTFLAPGRNLTLSGSGSVSGAFFASGHITVSGNGLAVQGSSFCIDDNPSPTPAPSSTPSATPTATPMPSPTPSSSPSPSASPTPVYYG